MGCLSYGTKRILPLMLSLLLLTRRRPGAAELYLSFPKTARPMEQTLAHPPRYSAEEYFSLEEKSRVRHEFFAGEVFAMAGESIAHNTIAQNVAFACRQALRGRKCRVLMEGVQLTVE